MAIDPFQHLEMRCKELIGKYASPIIKAEDEALQNMQQLPDADLDQLVALRLMAHAELEGYFEAKAQQRLDNLRSLLVADSLMTSDHAALIFLHMQKKQVVPAWTPRLALDEKAVRDAEISDFKNLANAAFGFANDFIQSNNGIKENSIYMLAAIAGRFPGDLSNTLVTELNQLGIDRGAVAHMSWRLSRKANVQSATIEKNRIENILQLIKDSYEISLNSGVRPTSNHVPTPTSKGPSMFGNWIRRLFRPPQTGIDA